MSTESQLHQNNVANRLKRWAKRIRSLESKIERAKDDRKALIEDLVGEDGRTKKAEGYAYDVWVIDRDVRAWNKEVAALTTKIVDASDNFDQLELPLGNDDEDDEE